MGTHRLSWPIVAIVTALLLAACSGSDPPSQPNDEPTSQPTTEPIAGSSTAPTTPPATTAERTTVAPDDQPASTTSTTDRVTTTTTVPEPLQLAVEPASGLLDGDIVTVTGTGLRTTDIIVVGECVDDTPLTFDDCEPAILTRPEGRYSLAENGTLDTKFRVFARFTTRGGEAVDCRDTETDCLIVAASALSDDPLAGSTLPVSFDPDGALAEPGVSITDTDELVDGETIGVSVWGLPPATPVAIGQCLIVDGRAEACETEIAVFAPRRAAEETGRMDTTTWVHAEFEGYDRNETVSCRPPATCELHVAIDVDVVWDNPTSWAFPLTFDADAPLAEAPEIMVTPSAGLVDGQVVGVALPDVLATRPSLTVVQCAGAPVPVGCDRGTATWVPAPFDAGAIEAIVRARLTTASGDEVDCREPGADCSLAVTPDLDAPGRHWGVAAIGFDPDGALAPPPTVTIVEGERFEERTYVTVLGSGFAPNGDVQIGQCAVGSFHSQACSSVGTALTVADGEGEVEWTHPVMAAAGAADCSEPGLCELRIVTGFGLDPGFYQATSAAAPLVVTPLADGVRYLDPVFDGFEVRAGIVYGRGLDNDGSTIDLVLDVYLPGGDTADDRPVIIWGRGDAIEFARRGFVVITTRLDVMATRESIELGYFNTVPVLDWLEQHADELRIDTDRIAAAGQSRGGFISTSLAYAPVSAEGEPPLVAAAISMAGGSVPDLIEPGEPPSLMLHGVDDGRVPMALAQQTCDAAAAQGVECTLVEYPGRGHEVGLWNDLIFDIWDRTARFLVDELDLG